MVSERNNFTSKGFDLFVNVVVLAAASIIPMKLSEVASDIRGTSQKCLLNEQRIAVNEKGIEENKQAISSLDGSVNNLDKRVGFLERQ